MKRTLTTVVICLMATAMLAQTSPEEESAIKSIRADTRDPINDQDHYISKINEYTGKGMYGAAEAAMKRLYDAYPNDYYFTAFMGWHKLLNGKPQEAIQLGFEAISEIGFDPLAPKILALAHACAGDTRNAQKYMKATMAVSVESFDMKDMRDDIARLKSIGYPGGPLDALATAFSDAYQSDFKNRQENINKLRMAQAETSPDAKLTALEGIIHAENTFVAPRTEILGAAYSEAAAAARAVGNIRKSVDHATAAVSLLEPLKRDMLTVPAMNTLGHALNASGEKDKAIKAYQEAISLIDAYQGDLLLFKDAALNGLGGVYSSIGEYNLAITYYEDAIRVARANNDQEGLAIAQDNLATVYIEQGKNISQALSLLKNSEATYQRRNNRSSLAINYNNQGFAHMVMGNFDGAVTSFRKAEELFRALDMKSSLADVNRSIGKLLMMLDRKVQAIEYYKKSLQYVDEQADPATAMSTYANLAGAELGQEMYREAATHAAKAIEINESLLKNASAEVKRGLLAGTNNNYRIQSLAYHRLGEYGKAFEAHERNRSRVMQQKMGIAGTITPAQVQGMLAPHQALIDFNVVHLHWEIYSHFFPIVFTSSGSKGFEFSDSTMVGALKMESESNFVAFMGQRSMLTKIREYVEEKGIPANVAQSLVRDANLELTVEFYRHLIKNPSPGNEVLRKSYARVFYDYLFKRIDSQLAGKTELIIIPDGPLAFLPFETLLDGNGKYLAEKYTIRYIQSATILQQLQKRQYQQAHKPLLAFAGPTFEDVSPSEVNMYRAASGQVQFGDLLRGYHEAEAKSQSMRPTYVKMGFIKMTTLPGTIYETDQIKTIVPDAEMYRYDQASENQLKALAKADLLKDYKVLHFATHGWAYAEIPELSTIVLGQFATEKGGEDGYLRVPEIEKLNLNADFVNLSACETALGRLYSGEGVVGLTQAFLVAGARGISVTQWTVSDEGTAIFMAEAYRKVFAGGQSFLEAITATRREFIQGKYGEKFLHPDFWGPFVYYGI